MLACFVGATAQAQLVGLQQATATFSQNFDRNYFPSEMIDGFTGPSNGWAIFDGSTSAQTAAFETTTDLNANHIDLGMDFNHGTQHLLGRFRLSATTDDRSTFADGLPIGGDVTANWTVLNATSISVPAGLTGTVLGDGNILVSGTVPMTGSYAIGYDLPMANVTGFRLEAMEDPSLPTNGPGLMSNGNFVVSELTITASSVPEPASLLGLALGVIALRRRKK